MLLDSRKTGHAVRPHILQADRDRYNRSPPPCMADVDYGEIGNTKYLRRSARLPKFILEDLLEAGKTLQSEHLRKYDELGKHLKQGKYRDEGITSVYKRFSDLDMFHEEVLVVKRFVEQLRIRWREMWGDAPQPGAKDKATKRNADNQKLHSLVADFMRGPDEAATSNLRAIGMLEAVAASYAYSLNPRFGFNVAFRELTTIKAKACGLAPTSAKMAACMTVSASVAHLLTTNNNIAI